MTIRSSAQMKLRVAPDRIHLLKFILEGYDGLAILSTVDPLHGVVSLRFSRENETELRQLLDSITSEVKIDPAYHEK